MTEVYYFEEDENSLIYVNGNKFRFTDMLWDEGTWTILDSEENVKLFEIEE